MKIVYIVCVMRGEREFREEDLLECDQGSKPAAKMKRDRAATKNASTG